MSQIFKPGDRVAIKVGNKIPKFSIGTVVGYHVSHYNRYHKLIKVHRDGLKSFTLYDERYLTLIGDNNKG